MSTLADCALRNVNATTVAASRHPDHHPLSYSCLSRFPAGFPTSCGFPVPAGCAWRRARLTVCTLRTALCRISEIPSGRLRRPLHNRADAPRKIRTKEIRDNCPNITNFLCQQTYITISTKYTGDNQPLKSPIFTSVNQHYNYVYQHAPTKQLPKFDQP